MYLCNVYFGVTLNIIIYIIIIIIIVIVVVMNHYCSYRTKAFPNVPYSSFYAKVLHPDADKAQISLLHLVVCMA